MELLQKKEERYQSVFNVATYEKSAVQCRYANMFPPTFVPRRLGTVWD